MEPNTVLKEPDLNSSWLSVPDNQEKILKNIQKKKPCGISFLILAPLLLLSGITFTFLMNNSLTQTKDQPNIKHEIDKENQEHKHVVEQEVEKEQEQEKEQEEEETNNVPPPKISYLTLSPNENFVRPLSDSDIYELIKLENDLEILGISKSDAIRSGFSFAIDISAFKEKHEQNINFNYFDNFAQYYISSHTQEASDFSKEIIRDSGNFKFSFDNNNNIHSFYCDVEHKGLKRALRLFHNMIYKTNILSSIDQETTKQLLSLSKVSYDKYYEPKLSGKYNDRFVKIIDLMLKGENVEKNNNIPLTNYMKDMIILSYNNTKTVKLSVISKYSISELKELIIPIWENDISHDKSKESPIKPNLNKISNSFLYSTKSAFSTGDIVIQCVNNINSDFYQYIIYMIKDDSELSGSNVLIHHSLITKIAVRLETIKQTTSYLIITGKLTNQGSNDINYIMQIILDFFRQLNNYDNYENTYNDVKGIFQQKFNFKTVEKYPQYLNEITSKLGYLPKNKIGKGLNSDDLPEYNYDKVKEMVISMSDASNYSLFIGFSSSDELANTIQKGDYSEYTFDSVKYYTKVNNINDWIKNINIQFKFKGNNKYITKETKIKQVDSLYFNKHILDYQPIFYSLNETIRENELWYKNDECFKIPKIEAYFHFNYAKMDNFFKIKQMIPIISYFEAFEIGFFTRIKRTLTNRFVSLDEAGNDIKLSFNRAKGFTLKISSYSDKLVEIVSDVFETMYNSEIYLNLTFSDFEPISYETANEKFIDYLYYYNVDTLKFKKIAKQLLVYENRTVVKPYTVMPEGNHSLVDYFDYFFKPEAKIKSLIYGDLGIGDEIAKKIGTIIKQYATKTDYIRKYPSLNGIVYKQPYIFYGNCYIYRYNDAFWKGDKYENFMINAFYLGNRTATLEVMSDLLVNNIKEVFKNKYDINSNNPLVEKVYYNNGVFLKFVKTSSIINPEQGYNETTSDGTELLGEIRNITNDKFNVIKEYLIKKNEQPPLTLKEKAEKVWYEIYEEIDYFDLVRDYKDAVKRIKRIEFVNFAKEVLTSNVYLSFQFYADKSLDSVEIPKNLYNNFRKKQCKVSRKDVFKNWDGTLL